MAETVIDFEAVGGCVFEREDLCGCEFEGDFCGMRGNEFDGEGLGDERCEAARAIGEGDVGGDGAGEVDVALLGEVVGEVAGAVFGGGEGASGGDDVDDGGGEREARAAGVGGDVRLGVGDLGDEEVDAVGDRRD